MPLMILFVKDSVSESVAKVPDVGNVILLFAVVVKVKLLDPIVVKLPPKVIVLPILLTPVPPLAPEIGALSLSSVTAPSAIFTLVMAPFVIIGFAAVELDAAKSPPNRIFPNTTLVASDVVFAAIA